jgi:8-oxo-dGTP pyrophosphatase MutT (NUDIX family)
VGGVTDSHDDPRSRPFTAAGVLYFNTAGDVLFVEPTYKPGLEIPGGYIAPGETPAEAAAREVVEELGCELPVGRLLVCDWAPQIREGDKILFVFDGGTLSQEQIDGIKVDGVEIGGFGFHPRQSIAAMDIPRLTGRVLAALEARDAGLTVYLEHGAPLA